MPTGDSFDAKVQVKEAVDIVDLLRDYVNLVPAGRGYKAICPWHDDHRPSLQVNPERQTFRCFVCNLGGDVFSWVMQSEGVDFPEALAMLAERAGISLRRGRQPASQAQEARREKQSLYDVVAWAEQQYHRCFVEAESAAAAREYLAQRQITPESTRRFLLGFAPDQWNWLADRAGRDGIVTDALRSAGLLVVSGRTGKLYEPMRGRLLFSIRNAQGRAVGFGGRILPGSESTSPAKYINSPETPLFAKNQLLYGLDLARAAIQKSHTAIVVEGYTDCIVAHQCGVENVVAVLGTALGENHIRQLRGLADRIVLVLDGDEAGQRRAGEILDLFIAQQVDLRILTLPAGLDPCDYLQQHDADEFTERVASAPDALDHKMNTLAAAFDDRAGTFETNQAVEEVLATLAKAPRLAIDTPAAARLKQQQILHRLAFRAGVDEQDLRTRLAELRRSSTALRRRTETTVPATETLATLAPSDRELLQIAVADPGVAGAAVAQLGPGAIASEAVREILELCRALSETIATPTFGDLMNHFDSPRLQSLLVEAEHEALEKDNSDYQNRLARLIEQMQKREEVIRHRAGTAALRGESLDQEQQLEIYQRIVQQRRSRQGISGPMDG